MVRFRTVCGRCYSNFVHFLVRLRTDCCWCRHLRAIFQLMVRFRTNYRWICTCGLIMLVRNRTKDHLSFTFSGTIFVLIYHNCWNDFRPILAATVLIGGTISYRWSLVQTYTQRFRIIFPGTISYQSILTEFAPSASYADTISYQLWRV